MRRVMVAVLAAGSGAFAQSHPGATIFGNMVNTGVPPGSPAARGLAGQGRFFFGPPVAPHPRHSRTVIVPYPVFYGGYYGTPFEPDAPPQPYAPPAPGYYGASGYGDPSQAPVVIINQNYRPDSGAPPPEPTFRKYESPSHPFENQAQAPNDPPPTIYLIAMKDHTILPAIAYWVSGDTFNYITTEGSLNHATLDLVDRDFSRQLNAERQVEFNLPSR